MLRTAETDPKFEDALQALRDGDPAPLIAAHRARFGSALMTTPDQPPALPAPVPAPPPTPAVPPGYLPQEQVDRIAASEKAQGERAGVRKLITDLGLDPETTNADDLKKIVDAATARQRELESEAERTTREATEAAARSQREQQDAAADRLVTRKERFLGRAGLVCKENATAEEQAIFEGRLADAAKLLDVAPDATDEVVAAAVTALKTRIPGLFAAEPVPPVPPTQLPPMIPAGTPPGQLPPGDAFAKGAQRAANAGQQQPAVPAASMFQ